MVRLTTAAVVTLMRPGQAKGRVLRRFSSIVAAERYIAQRERIDPTGVHRGDYGIDATEQADAVYQGIRRKA